MTTPAPTFSQIRAVVQAVRRKVPDARTVGIHTPSGYSGERLRTDGAETYRIEQCDSTLAARIALLDEEPGVTVTVLVTGLSNDELGDDVLVRLASRKLRTIDSWRIVKELFQAQTIDPRLQSHNWIADRLLEIAAARNPAPAVGGYLDAEVVWPWLLERMIGLTGERPDLAAVLLWSARADNIHRFNNLAEQPRQAVNDWLTAQVGPAASAVLRCAAAHDGPDALPVGLVLGVVHSPQSGGGLDRAAGRLERFFGGATPQAEVLDRWHAAATEGIRLLDRDPRAKGGLLDRADEILRAVQAEDFAHLSDVLRRGFDQRLTRLGELLGQAVEGGASLNEPLQLGRDAIRRHDQAHRETRRLERIEMALRLIKWLKAMPDPAGPRSLAEAARSYLDQGAFVDWARSVLRVGDPVRGLSEGYARLLERVTARRETQNRSFAELLGDQAAAGHTTLDPVPVENILDEIIAPLAEHAPVLVILLDGMSAAVARELLTDVTRRDWLSLGPQGKSVRPGLAAIPSVTEVSRTSLFCGELRQGAAANEAAGFAGHPGLRVHCRSGQPPILFHKIALQEVADTSLASNVREAIASPQKRVVGVVVNAVDDHLLKGDQLDVRWTRDEIKVLPSLLYEARSARRIVILLNDHGHVIDYHMESRSGEGGERWRPDDGRPLDGELSIHGPRVLLGDGQRLIAPWNERLRYGMKKNGYHGGLTPQEMVIPITVLTSAELHIPGWAEVPDPTPEWWEDLAALAPPSAVPAPSVQPPPTRTAEPLWDMIEAQPAAAPVPQEQSVPGRPHWIAALLATSLFGEQKQLGGRAVPADDVFSALLTVLDTAGGKMTAAALARRMHTPVFRLRGLLAVMQRVLNVDGYAVLGRDETSDTIEWNRDLLLRQFELLVEDRP